MNADTNSTRRYPRTLQEAFGPCVDDHVEPAPLTPDERRQRDNRELAAVGVLCGLCILCGLFIIWSTAHA